MSKLKKVLLMCTAYVLVAALAIGGTIAYLQDEDSDVNVMTLGNVSIAQHEYQRETDGDGNYVTKEIDEQTSYVLEAFEQGKALLPATDPSNNGAGGWDSTPVRMSQVDSYGGMSVFANSNAQDKFVTVENTGKTAAYVRTLVAIECGEGDASLIGTSYHQTWNKNAVGKIIIDGNDYYVFEYVYAGAEGVRHENGVLPAGDTSYPSLAQIYLNSAATNEDCEALDGNDNGTLDILVLSQAVQAQGFENAQTALDTGFGVANEENVAEWFGGTLIPLAAPETAVEVTTFAELKAAVANGGDIAIMNDIAVEGTLVVDAPTVIYGQGNTLRYADSFVGTMVQSADVCTLNDVVLDGGNRTSENTFYALYVDGGNRLNVNGVVIENFCSTMIIRDQGGAALSVTDTKIRNNELVSRRAGDQRACLIWLQEAANTVFENVSITNNVVPRNGSAIGDGYLFLLRGAATKFDPVNLTVEGNECFRIVETYGAQAAQTFSLSSGSIKNNSGDFNIVGTWTIGADMYIESNIAINNGQGNAVSTLTNNGYVKGDISSSYYSAVQLGRGYAKYEGTGTVEGTNNLVN